MTRKIKLVGSFGRLGIIQLIDKAKHIATCLEGQPTKTAKEKAEATIVQVPFYDDLTTAINDLEVCNERCKTNKTAYVERDIIQKQLIDVLNKIKSYLETYHGDDAALLATTGYDLRKEPTPYGDLPAPTNMLLTSDQTGCISVNVKAVKGAKTYVYEYGLANDEATQVVVNSKSTLKITGLPSASIYRIRAAAVGTGTNRNFTQYKTVVVS